MNLRLSNLFELHIAGAPSKEPYYFKYQISHILEIPDIFHAERLLPCDE
jgi:hypothetical protein